MASSDEESWCRNLMASSDEEGEILPECVTNYHFVDNNELPISFSVLPIQWNEGEILGGLETPVFLHGIADDGLQKLYKLVVAWKFDLSCPRSPEISVLSKDKNWIKLEKPRKSFEIKIRKILITLRWLHFVRKNPEASGKFIWNHLLQDFSYYEVQPSENDLLDHMLLIREAARRDKDLAKSKYLLTIVERPRTNKVFHKDVQTTKKFKFIVDQGDDDGDNKDNNYGGEGFDEKSNKNFDTVCAICDNGGELLCCDGDCKRSFHATLDTGTDSFCDSLGYTRPQVEGIHNFLCKNCRYKQHQCYVCGILGSSDQSSGAEVYLCVSAKCGHFYHPKCVAKLIHPDDKTQAEELQEKITAGESFLCPVHKCCFCKQFERKDVHELQFAICRRCPKAYHRKCLPRSITFECIDENIQRAWVGLLPNRILIYCMDHKIVRELGTPERDHLTFPAVGGRKKKHNSGLLLTKGKAVASKGTMPHEYTTEKTAAKIPKLVEKGFSGVKVADSTKKIKKKFSEQDFSPLKKPNMTDATRNAFKDNINPVSENFFLSFPAEKSKVSLRNKSINYGSYQVKSKQQNIVGKEVENRISDKHVLTKAKCSRPSVDAGMEKRILTLMKESTSSFNVEEFISRQKVPTTHTSCLNNEFNRTITLGNVEGSVKAVQTALLKLEEGCTIEDAQAICEPEILEQIYRWKRRLQVYLAPFLHGMRYTSFGRHFTKVDKLKEIVDRLHWYVQNGDTIVDFGCGSNDFSCLMKEKLEKTGKLCSFKNYDLIQPKNNFNFEKRDWMSIRLEELPSGSQMIIGLNPPFGLANQFINKALKFRPKLLILIVPKETKRPGREYDLIWEDDVVVSGKSFYLPGSVDLHDKQLEQWNTKAPPLYLWSHSDWTARHKAIAQECGHISKELEEKQMEENYFSNYLTGENQDCYRNFSSDIDVCGNIYSILDDVPELNVEMQPDNMCIDMDISD